MLAELGPGRGTLMADALRAMRAVPGMTDAAEIHFVETSPVLREAQRERVPRATWHERIDTLPAGPFFLIANEFFDALPVVQYQRTDHGCDASDIWASRKTAYVPGARAVPAPADASPAARHGAAPLGAIAEISPASPAIAQAIATRIAAQGGAALIVDYGHARSAPGETLQALRGHEYADPFEAPGEADLTAHVDFEALVRAVRAGGAAAHGPVEQGRFLTALGIEARAAALRLRATATRGSRHRCGSAKVDRARRDGQLVQGAGDRAARHARARRICVREPPC